MSIRGTIDSFYYILPLPHIIKLIHSLIVTTKISLYFPDSKLTDADRLDTELVTRLKAIEITDLLGNGDY